MKLSCLPALLLTAVNLSAQQPSIAVDRGLYAYTQTSPFGVVKRDLRQYLIRDKNGIRVMNELEHQANMELLATQSFSMRTYRGDGLWLTSESITYWYRDGRIVTNTFPVTPNSSQGTLYDAGNVGIKAWVHPDTADRYLLIEYSTFKAAWPKPREDPCPFGDAKATVVGMFRTNGAAFGGVEGATFTGMFEVLRPGEIKPVSMKTPERNTIWEFVGADRCISCDTVCWLPAWPKPVSRPSVIRKTAAGYGVSFSALPGMSVTVSKSSDLSAWDSMGQFTMPDSGEITLEQPAGQIGFFRMEQR